MKAVKARPTWIALLLLLAVVVPASAQPPAQSAATLRATGTFASNGSFAGTITINRFEQRGNQIVAVGIVQGTLSRANRTIGTAVAAEVSWPVKVAVSGGLLADVTSAGGPRIVNTAWRSGAPSVLRVARVEAQGCTPLQVSLGAINVDLLGAADRARSDRSDADRSGGYTTRGSRVRRVRSAGQRGGSGEPAEQPARRGHGPAGWFDGRPGRYRRVAPDRAGYRRSSVSQRIRRGDGVDGAPASDGP